MFTEKSNEEKLKERKEILENIKFEIQRISIEPTAQALIFVIDIGFVRFEGIRAWKTDEGFDFEYPHGIFDPWNEPRAAAYITDNHIWHVIRCELEDNIKNSNWMMTFLESNEQS